MNETKRTKTDKYIQAEAYRDGYGRIGNTVRSDKWMTRQAITNLNTGINNNKSRHQGDRSINKIQSIDEEENSVIAQTIANYSKANQGF